MRGLSPTRSIRNDHVRTLEHLAAVGANPAQLAEARGEGRTKSGIFEGDLQGGDLEIGQGAGLIHSIERAGDVVSSIVAGYGAADTETTRHPDTGSERIKQWDPSREPEPHTT